MTIGNLLKEYRIKAGKTQRSWIGEIISPSFYSKVEKGLSRISAEDLIELLRRNHVNLASFFDEIDYQAKSNDALEKEIITQITDAYYDRDLKHLKEIKQTIINSTFADKDELLLRVDSVLAIIEQTTEKLSSKEKSELKSKFFNAENFDRDTITIFLNFMYFYDFGSDLVITKKIFRQFKNSNAEDTQFIVLGILINMIEMCISENKYTDAWELIEMSKQVPTKPITCFSKMLLLILENLLNYHDEPRQVYIDNCQKEVEQLSLIGMTELSKSCQRMIDENTKMTN